MEWKNYFQETALNAAPQTDQYQQNRTKPMHYQGKTTLQSQYIKT
jgi:hypothetical protein